MKLRLKTYLLTLSLFIFCIVSSFVLMIEISESSTYRSETEKRLTQQHTIAQAFSTDAANVVARKPSALQTLAESYIVNYMREGILISIKNGDDVIASSLPMKEYSVPSAPEVGERLHTIVAENSINYLVVTARLPSPDTIVITCAFDMSDFYTNGATLVRISIIIGIIAVILLAIVLYFILRQISRPIEKLAIAAKEIESGNYDTVSDIKSKDEVGQLAAAFNQMAKSVHENIQNLEVTAKEKQVLFDTLAHEIRTPLTAVAGYAQYLQHANVSKEDEYESLQYIIDESNRLSAMCSRILQMAALRGEKARIEDVNMREVFKATQKTMRPKALLNKVELKFYCEGNCVLQGEKVLIESLVLNLVTNAINACKNGDKTYVSAVGHGDKVCLSVKDTGCGMSEEVIARVGEYFYRPDKARSRTQGGAGLGVPLCYQIAQSHGTHIIYKSKENEGTLVSIDFKASNGFV